MSLSASFFGDCCFPDINSRSLVAEICDGWQTTPSGELVVAAGGARVRARTAGAGEQALMTMVAGTEKEEADGTAAAGAGVGAAGRGEATRGTPPPTIPPPPLMPPTLPSPPSAECMLQAVRRASPVADFNTISKSQ